MLENAPTQSTLMELLGQPLLGLARAVFGD